MLLCTRSFQDIACGLEASRILHVLAIVLRQLAIVLRQLFARSALRVTIYGVGLCCVLFPCEQDKEKTDIVSKLSLYSWMAGCITTAVIEVGWWSWF